MKKLLIRILVISFLSLGGALPSFAALDYNIKNDSQSFLFISGTSGNVGIGTILPVGKFEVRGGNAAPPKTVNINGTFADLAASRAGLYVDMTAATTNAFIAAGSWSEVRTTADAGTYGSIVAGAYAEAVHDGLATVDDLTGIYALANHRGSGDVGNAYGIIPQVWKGSGLMTNAWGLYFQGVPTVNGDTTLGDGTLQNQYGLGIGHLDTGTLRNVAVLLDDNSTGAAVEGAFGILQEDTAVNSFAGNIGMGTTEVTAQLVLHSTGVDLIDSHLNEDTTGDTAIESHYKVGRSGDTRTTPSDVQRFRFFSGTGTFQEVAQISVNTPTVTSGKAIGAIDMYTQDSAGVLVKRMTIDEHKAMFANNLGLGTTEPAARLHIAADNSQPNAMAITGADAYIKGNLEVDGKIYGDGSLLSNLPGGTEADTLDSVTARGATTVNAVGIGSTTVTGNLTTTGNVGVGSTVPGSLLDVAGTAQLRGAAGGTGLYVNSNGNVGIGMTAPVSYASLTLADNLRLNGSTIYFNGTTTKMAGSNATNYLSFTTSDSERIRVISTGNIGIGTTAPLANLQVGWGTNTVAGSPALSANDALITGNLVVDGKIYGDGSLLTNLPAGTEADTLATVTGRDPNTVNAVGIGTTTVTGGLTTTGNVGIGSTTPGAVLDLQAAANTKSLVVNSSVADGNFLIDPNGVVRIGASLPATQTLPGLTTSIFEVVANSGSKSDFLYYLANNTGAAMPAILLAKSRGTSSARTAVANSEALGSIWANGYDGTNFKSAAAIDFQVDATPGSNDMPGRIVFKTSPDGSSTMQTRMTIKNSGNIGIGTTIPISLLEVGVQQFNVSAAGNVGIGTTSPVSRLNLGAPGTITSGLTFGDGDTGFYEDVDDRINFASAGTMGFFIENWDIKANRADGYILRWVNSTSTVPAYAFISDTDTGIGRAGANILSLIAGGVNGLNVDGAGNVGIGTTAPLANLQVGRGTNTVAGAPTLGANDALITGNLVVDGKIYGDGSLLSNLPSTAEVDTLDSVTDRGATTVNAVGIGTTTVTGGLTTTGNVGIGSALPQAMLDIKQTSDTNGIRLSNTAGDTASIYVTTTPGKQLILNSQSGHIYFQRGGVTQAYINSTGISVITNKKFSLGSNEEATMTYDGTNYVINPRAIGTGNAIFSAGNVGIGTNSPVARLHVATDTSVPDAMSITGADAYIKGNLEVDGKIYGDGSLLSNLPGGTEADTLDSVTARGATTVNAVGIGTTTVTGNLTTTGNVGVGSTVPGSLLDVAGTAQLRGAAGGTGLYVSSAGNVGIGTAVPSSKFNINGGVGALSTGLTFGDGDTGFYESADDTLWFVSAGSLIGNVTSSGIVRGASGAWALSSNVGTATVPTFMIQNDTDTGIGYAGTNILSLIAGGVNGLNVIGSGNVGVGTTLPAGLLDVNRKLTVLSGGNVGIGSILPVSTLVVNGSMAMTVVTKTTNYTATAADFFIRGDTTGGNVTITLPAVAGLNGRMYVIKKVAAANSLTIDGNASETIDGATTAVLTNNNDAVSLVCNGTSWDVF